MNVQTARREYAPLSEDERRQAGAAMRVQPQRTPALPQKSPKTKKPNMPKAQALALTHKLKNALVVASVLCFGSLGGFLLGHTTITAATSTQTTTVTSQATPTSTSQTSSTSTSQTSNATSTSSTSSSSSQQGGSNFGSTSTSQAPVSGSSVS